MLANPIQQLGRHRMAQKLFRGLMTVKAQAFKILALVVLLVAVHVVDVYGDVSVRSATDDAATVAFAPTGDGVCSISFADRTFALPLRWDATYSLTSILLAPSHNVQVLDTVFGANDPRGWFGRTVAVVAEAESPTFFVPNLCSFSSPLLAGWTVAVARIGFVFAPSTLPAGHAYDLMDSDFAEVHLASNLSLAAEFLIQGDDLLVVGLRATRHDSPSFTDSIEGTNMQVPGDLHNG